MITPCRLCTAYCCKNYLITVTSFDVFRIMEGEGEKPSEFAQLVPARILNPDNGTILECYEGGERYEQILTFPSHPCYFLKGDRCTIYASAPLICRLYPYNTNGKMVPRAHCPTVPKLLFQLKGTDIRVKKYADQMDTYKKIVARWNRKHGKKEDCMEFLLRETKRVEMSIGAAPL